MRRQGGQTIGPWRLNRLLGSGANAEVWEASNERGDIVAVKVLHRVDPDSEPYKRFRDEISVLREVGNSPGVLPIVDSHLPDKPSRGNPAWLAMPVATPIREALSEADVETTVSAIASIAETLSRLAERGVFHRDIKPENLYQHGQHWVVGDLGLVEFPSKEALTQQNRKLGPMYYLAPEMLTNASRAEAGPADVYSLAKTLWVLVGGQNYPWPGEQRGDRAGTRISDVVVHARSHLLDRLLERATVDAPAARPTMAEMATEIRAWLRPPIGAPAEPDLSELAARVASTFGPGLKDERRREELTRSAVTAFQKIYETVKGFTDRFLLPIGLRGFESVTGSNEILKSYLPRGDVTTATGEALMWQNYAILPVTAPSPGTATLWVAVGAKLFDNGDLDLAGALLMGRYDFPQEEVWSLTRSVAAGSAQEEQTVAELIAGLGENLPRALEAFLDLAAQKQ